MNATMRATAENAAAKAKPALERVTTMAHDAIDRAASMPSQAKDWIGARSDQMSAIQKKLVNDASSYVSANPLKAIGIAVVAALLVGRLMK